MLVHPCMAGYSPKDSPRPVPSTVSRMCTDQTREYYRSKLISLSRALEETELTSGSVNPSNKSIVNLYSSKVICNSIVGSTLVDFLHTGTLTCREKSDEFQESSKRMVSECDITSEQYRMLHKSCDQAWENWSYLHKLHLFILWCLSPVLYMLYKICKFHWIPYGMLDS